MFLCKILINFYFPFMTISSEGSFSFPTQISYALFIFIVRASSISPFSPACNVRRMQRWYFIYKFLSKTFQHFLSNHALLCLNVFGLSSAILCSAFPSDSYQYHSSYSKRWHCNLIYLPFGLRTSDSNFPYFFVFLCSFSFCFGTLHIEAFQFLCNHTNPYVH
jgi:hypothetical protein